MTLTSQPLVSVVTPVYNTEKYLTECIESVLSQTYENWEYVVVNNCSTDKSLEIARRYAQKDSRIRIHNNVKFLDQIPNWNHAMQQISPESKYCKVVHADDWLFPECITRMVEVAESNSSIGITGAYRLDQEEVNLDGLPYPISSVSGRKICQWRLLGGPYLFGSPTSLLIRSDIIRNREQFYNESNIHADNEVCFDILQDYDFGFVHQVLTFTRRHNETTTTFCRKFKTHVIGNLIILKKYGPIYLSSKEYEKHLKKVIESYHRFLVRNVFELKGKQFFNYHKKEFENIGVSISLFKLIKASFLELLNIRDIAKIIKISVHNKLGTVPHNIKINPIIK